MGTQHQKDEGCLKKYNRECLALAAAATGDRRDSNRQDLNVGEDAGTYPRRFSSNQNQGVSEFEKFSALLIPLPRTFHSCFSHIFLQVF